MWLSLREDAHAAISSAAWQEIRFGLFSFKKAKCKPRRHPRGVKF
jgi:hypothetical protein